MERIKSSLESKVLVIRHEDLILDTGSVLNKICNFVNLESPLKVNNVDYSTLNKWRDRLTGRDLKEIFEVTGIKSDDVVTKG